MLKKINEIKKYLYILIIPIIILILFKSTLFYQFNFIDEHQIVQLLGPDNHLSFIDLKKHLLNKYSLILDSKLRITLIHLWWPLETFFFKNVTAYYYILRLTIISIFFLTLFIYSSKLVGENFSILLTLIFVLSNAFSDIATRLIVPEFLTIVALIFLIPIFYNFFDNMMNNKSVNFSKISLIFYFIFFNVLILSKESMAIYAIFPIIFIFLFFKTDQKSKLFFIINSANIFSFFLYVYLTFSGQPDWSHHISFELKDNFKIILKIGTYLFKNYWIYFLLVFYIYFRFKKVEDVKKLSIIFLVFLLIISFQFFIYRGNLPSNTRYDFVNDFSFFLTSLLLVYILKKDKENYSKILKFFFIFLICVFFFKSENFFKHNFKAENKRLEITHFSSSLNKIENLAKKYPNNEIVLISNYVWEYELVSSLFKFIKYRNINNKIFLKVNILENDLNNRTENMLFKRLIEVSNQSENIKTWANNPKLEWGYEDLNTLSGSKNCIEVEIYRVFATWISKKNSERLCNKSAH